MKKISFWNESLIKKIRSFYYVLQFFTQKIRSTNVLRKGEETNSTPLYFHIMFPVSFTVTAFANV